MRFALVCLLVFTVACIPVVVTGAPSAENPCSCTFWEPTKSDAALKSLTIEIKADTVVGKDDSYFLKMVDKQGKTVHYAKLTIPKGGENVITVNYDDTIASQLYMAVLFSPKVDVKMKYMKVVGKLADGEHVFFDKGCEGIVVGPNGCMRMELW